MPDTRFLEDDMSSSDDAPGGVEKRAATGCAAVVVGYFPEFEVLLRLLRSLAPQVDHLFLVDNGGARDVAMQAAAEGLQAEWVDLHGNLGLGYALNEGFKRAREAGAAYVATFDQDSDPPEGLIAGLKGVHERLKNDGIDCAAVGPVFFDRRAVDKRYFPFYKEEGGRIVSSNVEDSADELIETDALITSGMLVRMDAWESTRYDAGFFVDYTDTDWSFRIRARGHRLFGCAKIEMGHALSEGLPIRFLGLSFFRYSPLRRYFFYRNSVYFCTRGYVSAAWRRRISVALAIRLVANIFVDEKKLKSLQMMLRGVRHGLTRRMGGFQ